MRQSWFSKGLWIVLALMALSLVFYAVVGFGKRAAKPTTSGSRGAATASVGKTAADVPQSVLQKITHDVSDVPGVNELFVNANPAGGYDVSATIDVGTGATQKQINSDVNQFLKGVYSSHLAVQDAQVYLLENGQIVAGAGLGATVFNQLTSQAGVSNFSFVAALQGTHNNVQGADDKWFQSQLPDSP